MFLVSVPGAVLNFGRDNTPLLERAGSSATFYFEDAGNKHTKIIKSFSETTSVWTVVTSEPGPPLPLFWSIPNHNPGYKIYFVELSEDDIPGVAIDLTDRDPGTDPISLIGPTRFELIYGPLITDTFPALLRGWNLVSLPLVTTSNSRDLFGGIADGNLWSWNQDQSGFKSHPLGGVLKPGVAFWIYSLTNNPTMLIEGLEGGEIPNLIDGWNLAGPSVDRISLDTQAELDDIRTVWGIDAGTSTFVKVTDFIHAYRGYWMFKR
jgi:hypothetical protein